MGNPKLKEKLFHTEIKWQNFMITPIGEKNLYLTIQVRR